MMWDLQSPRFAPGVVATWLPFGGLVLVAADTLAIAEFGERDAAAIRTLLTGGEAALRNLHTVANRLIADGWLVSGIA
jgi:hypothetical protein